LTGTISKLIFDRGFGFIAGDDGARIFFHHKSVVDGGFDNLLEGQSVTFDTEPDPRGPQARNVRVAAVASTDNAPTAEGGN
jgi:CspA family cold shock protein